MDGWRSDMRMVWWEDGWVERWLRERMDDECRDGQRDGSHYSHTIKTSGCLGSTGRLLCGEWARPEQCSESRCVETDTNRQD